MKPRITPETYEEMNKKFEEEGMQFRIEVPTQKQIDKHLNQGENNENINT